MAVSTKGNAPPARTGRGVEGARLGGRERPQYTADPVTQFTDAMLAAGVIPAEHLDLSSGVLCRFRLRDDKPGRRNGWAVLHLDGVPAGAFGDWRSGARETWSAAGRDRLSTADRIRINAAIAEARRQRQQALTARWASVRGRAEDFWGKAAAARASHPYLLAKRVRPHGLRQRGPLLLVPMRDQAGVLWNVQTIAPDGEKRFMPGGRKRGLYHSLGGPVSETLCVAEGYATAATIHEATRYPVAVAFDCGNLGRVCELLREKYPSVRMVVCADNDSATAARIGRNPGMEAASEAARKVGGVVAAPEFGQGGDANGRE